VRSIPQSILNKINKQNQTLYENANPKMEVTVSRAKTTVMDSDYWTVETIREKAGLGDVSLAPRRFTVRGRPNRIYEIHVDNGVVGTAIREYPDRLKDGWQNQFELGTGSKVGIAFNGHWERYRKLWRLVTDEKPHIMWVDGEGKLQTQLWDDSATKQELAAGVTYVRALRGWKNVNFIDKDQGIIAGYIKSDGSVWYRNYCSQLDGTSTWENERQLSQFTGTAVSLNLFITNDYRMGFIIEDSLGKIYWYITTRNWAGMAIAPENIKASFTGLIDFIKIEKIPIYEKEYISASVEGSFIILWGNPYNDFISASNFGITMQDEHEEDYQNWGYRINVVTEHRMTGLDYTDFTLVDENDANINITAIEETSINHYVFEIADMNNASGDLSLSFITGDTKGEAGQDMNNFNIIFTPTNLVPTFTPLPEVEEVWNE